jgi:hypothetical protein
LHEEQKRRIRVQMEERKDFRMIPQLKAWRNFYVVGTIEENLCLLVSLGREGKEGRLEHCAHNWGGKGQTEKGAEGGPQVCKR